MQFKNFTGPVITVTTAATAVPLQANDLWVTSVTIQADNGNSTGNIYIGDSTVTSSNGLQLATNAYIAINADNHGDIAQEFNLKDIYICGSADGVKARYFYNKRRP